MIEQNIGLNMGRESCLREIEQIRAENANYIPTTEDKLSGYVNGNVCIDKISEHVLVPELLPMDLSLATKTCFVGLIDKKFPAEELSIKLMAYFRYTAAQYGAWVESFEISYDIGSVFGDFKSEKGVLKYSDGKPRPQPTAKSNKDFGGK